MGHCIRESGSEGSVLPQTGKLEGQRGKETHKGITVCQGEAGKEEQARGGLRHLWSIY